MLFIVYTNGFYIKYTRFIKHQGYQLPTFFVYLTQKQFLTILFSLLNLRFGLFSNSQWWTTKVWRPACWFGAEVSKPRKELNEQPTGNRSNCLVRLRLVFLNWAWKALNRTGRSRRRDCVAESAVTTQNVLRVRGWSCYDWVAFGKSFVQMYL